MSESVRNALFSYPPQAAFGRTLPKNKLYEKAGANSRLKDLFVSQVEQIVWQYKLAPETINLPARVGVPELQVFSLHLKVPELNLDVLRCIDGAVQYPIIFELHFDGRVQTIACHKRPSEADASKWVCSDYFASSWQFSDAPRNPLPMALDLAALYESLLRQLISLPARPQEKLADQVQRMSKLAVLQRAVEKTQAQLAKEKQFNRKVGINSQLRELKTELEELSR
ncbi:MAG: DUF4391 domain-containing protein [Alphaproteobacteria bacterium]|nr:DUF4391 domain-containing protein [Alphaproteobacteria bacterium]